MPELPEVEIVRRRLLTCLPGLLLREVVVSDARVSDCSEAGLQELLAGRRVTGLRRRGKYLIIDLGPTEDGESSQSGEAGAGATSGGARAVPGRDHEPWSGPSIAVIHLRMTGQLLFQAGPAERPPRFVWRLDPATELSFQDVRRFGRLWAFKPDQEDAFFSWMGPEPFSDAFSVSYLRGALGGRTAPLKSFLLDQRRIAGVGNIYADEALFRARLHPLRAAGRVGPREAKRLHAALLETLQAGIDHEGSSIESFVDPAGERGGFQEILSVYQRTGEPCRVCGTTVRRTVVGGRGTHFCPRCQPARGGISPSARRRPSTDVSVRGKPPDFAAPGPPAPGA
jgi:formamidopyrimidine-DNA glycosylase